MAENKFYSAGADNCICVTTIKIAKTKKLIINNEILFGIVGSGVYFSVVGNLWETSLILKND
jgi:hypothetical protein